MQLTHKSSRFKEKKYPIILVCDHLYNASNVGSMLRLADAFGLQKVYFIGKDTPVGRKMKRASRSTEKYVDFDVVVDSTSLLDEYRFNGYKIVALEITSKSDALNLFKAKQDDKIVLIVGNEIDGISDAILKLCDMVFHIEMYGKNSSMNVSTSASIALFHISNQLLSHD